MKTYLPKKEKKNTLQTRRHMMHSKTPACIWNFRSCNKLRQFFVVVPFLTFEPCD